MQHIRTHWWRRKRSTFIYSLFNQLTQLLAQEMFIKMGMNFTSWTWKSDYDTMLIRLERCNWGEVQNYFWQGCKVKHCNAEFWSQRRICFRTEETHGQHGSPCPVARPFGQLTSRRQLGVNIRKPYAVFLFL